MGTYTYSRELIDGQYNINNKDRVDGEGNQIYLFEEIKNDLPGKKFRMDCFGPSVIFTFNDILTSEEQTTLSNTITNHKNNT